MTCKKRFNQSGFTLIEIIVTVVIVAILGAMVLTFLSKSLVDSSEPVKRFQKTSVLNSIMANITADFNRYPYPQWRQNTAYAANTFIVPTIRNGHYYKCTKAGTSDKKYEPEWPLIAGSTKTDGSVEWMENGSLISLVDLQSNINNKNYGTYDVVYNTFVYFPVGSDLETAGGSNILKVTIKNDQGETLSALFISN